MNWYGLALVTAANGIDSLDPAIKAALFESLERDGFVSRDSPAYIVCMEKSLIHDDGYVLGTVTEVLRGRGVTIKPLTT